MTAHKERRDRRECKVLLVAMELPVLRVSMVARVMKVRAAPMVPREKLDAMAEED